MSRKWARTLAHRVLDEWTASPADRAVALADGGMPLVQQRIDEETEVAYMETVSAIRDVAGARVHLAVAINPVPISPLQALLALPVTASGEVPVGP